jgi:glycosyltransferase involved in cell wall biosynthesis
MKSLGHTVYHYGVGCDVECDADIIVSEPIDMDWSGTAPWWKTYNRHIITEINKRKHKKDFICVINGKLNADLSEIQGVQVVEFAIGYTGTFAQYRVFASYSHMHRMLGAQGGYDPNGHFYDVVIPHFLNPDDYPLGSTKSDYFLYIGRLETRKGLQIAVDTCKYLGVKLKIAGPGEPICTGDHLEYLGPVNGQEKIGLYQNAIATFTPSLYLEPFGMTTIESQMCGTPTITTDWGAYPETVINDLNGYRCRTLNQFVIAAKKVKNLSPNKIRENACKLWDINNIRFRYQEYFESLQDLWGEGWNAIH